MISLSKQRKTTLWIILGLLAFLLLMYIFKKLNYLHFINDTFQILLTFELTLVVKLLNWMGSSLELYSNKIILTSYNTVTFDIQYLLKKWTAFLIILIWATPTETIRKIKYTLYFVPIYFVVITIKLMLIVKFCQWGFMQEDARSFGVAIAVLFYLFFLLFWIKKNPVILEKISSFLKLDIGYIRKKYNILVVFLFLMVAVEIILGLFQFRPWITFLFTSSQKILNLYHYDSIVDSFFLLGQWGNIYMAKGCLGIRTMLFFAMLVFLTGEDVRRKLIYTSIGIVVINIVNILRFVYLFMFIQTHNINELRYDIHEVFNFVVYTIVFVMLIIWFEWFTDIWPYLKHKKVN